MSSFWHEKFPTSRSRVAVNKNCVDVVGERIALEGSQVWTEVISCGNQKLFQNGEKNSIKSHSRGTQRTSRFFSRLSPRWPPAQSPMENLGVCLQICAYSFWYSLSFVTGSFTLFCFSFSDKSLTGKKELPHTTYSSRVS